MKTFWADYKSSICTIFLVVVVFMSGYLGGRGAGSGLLRSLLTGGDRLMLLLYMPSIRYFESIKYLDSTDELKRLTGYYSLLYNNKLDTDFLIKRFHEEKASFMKRNLIWLMGFATDERKVFDAFVESYGEADDSIKREMIRTLKRKGGDMPALFIKKMGVTPSITEGT